MWEFIKKQKRIIFSICVFFLIVFFCGGILFAENYYWENPERISGSGSCFPRAVSNGQNAAIFWQEVDTKNSEIYLSARFYTEGGWKDVPRFAGPFPYSGEIPDLYSAAMNMYGIVALGVLSNPDTVSIFTTDDFGETFLVKEIERQKVPLVAPRIYNLNSGGFIIFTSLGKDESFSMLFSRSTDGFNWNNFNQFAPASGLRNPFLPVMLSSQSADVVVFQAQYRTGNRTVYRLYSTQSKNDGVSWSRPVMLKTSGEEDLAGDQRPSLASFNGKTYIAWERTPYNFENSSIHFAMLDSDKGFFSGMVEQISKSGNANRPFLFPYNNELCLVWFDTRGGFERVYFCNREGSLWGEQKALSSDDTASIFVYPMITDRSKNLSFVWQTGKGDKSAIYRVEADTTALPPVITAIGNARGRSEELKLRITLQNDSSGVRGFSWVWTRNLFEDPPKELMNLPRENTLTVKASSENEWYLKARALDYAGNWSESAVFKYSRDLTPPIAPVIEMPELDEAGFVKNNSFTLRWSDNTPNEEVVGYSYILEEQYKLPSDLGSSKRHPSKLTMAELAMRLEELRETHPESSFRPTAPKRKIQTRSENLFFSNLQNGVYTFSVRSFDEAGNIGEPGFVTLYINKYEPYTEISSVKESRDVFGVTSLELNGVGFQQDGTISKITIAVKDSEEPFSFELNASSGDFTVDSDTLITGIKLDSTVPQGEYTITLHHTDRGTYGVSDAISVQEKGTVKIAHRYKYRPLWRAVYTNEKIHLQFGEILVVLVLIFALCALLFAIKGVMVSSRQVTMLNKEIHALFTGDIMPLEKKKRAAVLKRRGIGLKFKLVSFTAILVITVSFLVSVPLGYIMTRTQESTLASGLEERVNVLLGSLTSGVRAYMPTQNVLELSALPSQSAALSEANFVTITGLPSDDSSEDLYYVWASNDNALSEKTCEESLNPGVTKITNQSLLEISSNCAFLNQQAYSTAGEMAKNIAELNAEGASIVLRTDKASVARRNEISVITTQLTTRLAETLNEISEKNTASYPPYNSVQLDRENTEYLFYRPVLFRMGSSQTYVRSIVFISVSTATLIQNIEAERRTIVYTALAVALAAVLFGTIGAWILASIIVTPIKKLAAHVEMIGATANKEKLVGKEIIVKSRDEIGQLGESVNSMTRELVRAAQEEHLSMDGKVVQRAFLPLALDNAGAKQTVAMLKERHLECFGYYEGASEVSGDYFDYKKLDDRRYVLIKCDASGHGVPAALIMTVVATLFRRYYENWSFKKNGVDLDTLVTQINDFIESLGIKGKFATLILALIDTQSGDVKLCNAGDNIVHIFDNREKKEIALTLQETPAAGPLPTFMVQMKGGFKVEQAHLNKGDFLFLYTDGIEESTRKFRSSDDYRVIKCEETFDVKDGVHGNHKVGTESEQMEPYRIQDIIESVLNKRVYRLEKFHNPILGEVLEFDFTTCNATTEDVVLAMCSVEKVFRFYKDPAATENDIVQVDRRIDAFLREHFNRYDFYCGQKAEDNGEGVYMYYTGLREDEQLDDLTLLAVKIV